MQFFHAFHDSTRTHPSPWLRPRISPASRAPAYNAGVPGSHKSCSDGEARPQYQRRLEERRSSLASLERRLEALSNWRLIVFIVFVGLAYAAWLAHRTGPLAPLIALASFLVLIARHHRTNKALVRAGRAVAFYENGLLRVDDAWAGKGVSGQLFADPEHPYTSDLDIFGEASVFERLCLARTTTGQSTLAQWLKAPATADVVRLRQEAVKELAGRLDEREKFALCGDETGTGPDQAALEIWGARPLESAPKWLRPLAGALGLSTVAAALYFLLSASLTPVLALALAGRLLARAHRGRIQNALASVEEHGRQLQLLSVLLEQIENERFESQLLTDLKASLISGGGRPSVCIRRLQGLIELLRMRESYIFAPVAWIALWELQFALAIDAWRGRWGASLGVWLKALGAYEALSSLAGYCYERPEDVFPEIVESGPILNAQGLGHPLLPAGRLARNDVCLGPDRQLLIVSGSNMSGKSTFLRAIGVNVVLAQAGAPVCAGKLTLSALQTGATLRIQDSLHQSLSRFYSEITRLRKITGMAETLTSPDEHSALLFLLDEILQGTNSHDRLIGAAAVARSLVRRGSIGLITTHDLALTHLAEDPALHAANVHFQDRLEDGQMVFDYRLREGVVTRSNALELMKAVGLEV